MINSIKEIEKEFDEKFPRWPEPVERAGKEIEPLYRAKIFQQYNFDRDHRDEDIKNIKSFYRTALSTLLQQVGEDIETDFKKYIDAYEYRGKCSPQTAKEETMELVRTIVRSRLDSVISKMK